MFAFFGRHPRIFLFISFIIGALMGWPLLALIERWFGKLGVVTIVAITSPSLVLSAMMFLAPNWTIELVLRLIRRDKGSSSIIA